MYAVNNIIYTDVSYKDYDWERKLPVFFSKLTSIFFSAIIFLYFRIELANELSFFCLALFRKVFFILVILSAAIKQNQPLCLI